MTKKKSLTKKRLAFIWSETSSCYSEAVKEYGLSTYDMRQLYIKSQISLQELQAKLEELDEIYRTKLCALPSDVIEDVIIANEKSFQRRANKTIHTLSVELLERQLRNEEDRSS